MTTHTVAWSCEIRPIKSSCPGRLSFDGPCLATVTNNKGLINLIVSVLLQHKLFEVSVSELEAHLYYVIGNRHGVMIALYSKSRTLGFTDNVC